ncbi:organic cation transporter protein-like [Haliotis rubra]|uniref:organic cation transporter protein-like n=1 Tax=Haliotis rubra TaxID=36100 RepID=UPI001EE4EDA2|nr:organic cation transporter protein-like [Haliotis rubra]
MKFDNILETVGAFGPSQRRLYILLSLPAIYNAVILMVISVFLFAVPEHRCAIPGMKNDTFQIQREAHADLINRTMPHDNDNVDLPRSSCFIYSTSENVTSRDMNTVTEPCHKWIYDKSVYQSTVAQTMDLVCDRKLYVSHAKMMAMVGQLVGVLIGGPMSDKLAIGMGFYGLSMNVTNLSGNVYLNFLLFVLVEACAYVICLLLMERIGRKKMLCTAMLMAGIACALSFVPFFVTETPNKWIINILACLGNTCVSTGFAAVYVFTAELLPTTSRNFGMGISSVFCRIGSISSPYINDLHKNCFALTGNVTAEPLKQLDFLIQGS